MYRFDEDYKESGSVYPTSKCTVCTGTQCMWILIGRIPLSRNHHRYLVPVTVPGTRYQVPGAATKSVHTRVPFTMVPGTRYQYRMYGHSPIDNKYNI